MLWFEAGAVCAFRLSPSFALLLGPVIGPVAFLQWGDMKLLLGGEKARVQTRLLQSR